VPVGTGSGALYVFDRVGDGDSVVQLSDGVVGDLRASGGLASSQGSCPNESAPARAPHQVLAARPRHVAHGALVDVHPAPRRLWRVPVEHQPWPLHRARLERLSTSMLTDAGLPSPEGQPLVPWSPGVDVRLGRLGLRPDEGGRRA
jgi:hypothetical protein